MGAKVNDEYGTIECTAEHGLKGTKIILKYPSVGTTENIILAAVMAKGETIIMNAAREPEIMDLAAFLINAAENKRCRKQYHCYRGSKRTFWLYSLYNAGQNSGGYIYFRCGFN